MFEFVYIFFAQYFHHSEDVSITLFRIYSEEKSRTFGKTNRENQYSEYLCI